MEDEKLVYYIYNRLEKNNFIISNKEDLIQEGFIGLINAKKTYDTTKNVPFHNYAVVCIKNAMSNYIRQFKKHNSNISIYVSNNVDVDRVNYSSNSKYRDLELTSIDVPSDCDLVIEGLCFIKCSNNTCFEVYMPKGVDVYIREKLI